MNIKTQFCGLVILLVVLYFYIYHKKVKLKTEAAFLKFLCVMLVCVGLDITSVIAIEHMDVINSTLLAIICKAYVISVMAATYSALLYVCADIYKEVEVYKSIRLKFTIFLFVAAIVVSLLPIEYYHEALTGIVYTKGLSVLAGYTSGAVFLVALIIHIIFKSKEMNARRKNAMMVWVAVWVAAVLVQFFNNELLLMSFAGSFGIIIVYLMLENPEVNLDKDTGVFNQNALSQYIREFYSEGKSFAVLEVVIEKAMETTGAELCTYLLTIPRAKVFRYSSNNIMIVFAGKNKERALKIKDMVIERMEQGFGRSGNIVLRPYWYYLEDSTIVENGSEFFALIKYAHHIVLDKVSTDITYIDRDMAQKMYNTRKMEQSLEAAIRGDRIEVFYQPIYSTKEHKFVSAEALARIRDEDGNLVSPGIFIDIAESNGMILRFGEIVFDKVCRFISKTTLKELGLEYIEVNLSVLQCSHRNLAPDYLSIMNKYKIAPEMINLEITETASAGAKKILLENMRILLDKGISFSLDDFGTGHSNLNYIAEMPVSILKFDKEMVQSYFKSEKAKYVINAAVEMARGLNLSIVFEGIESIEQYREAERIGIDYIQGYYFSKPLPEYEFRMFMADKEYDISSRLLGLWK